MNPPMWLRNNPSLSQSRAEYLAVAEIDIEASEGSSADAILLAQPKDVATPTASTKVRPQYKDGAAQWAATLLAPQSNELILDACAAFRWQKAVIELEP